MRNEVVADMPSITLPVPRVTWLDRIRRVLRWTIPFGVLFAVGFFVIGFMLHPNRAALMHSLGFGMVLLAVADRRAGLHRAAVRAPGPQRQHVGRRIRLDLANDSLPLLVGLAIVLGGGGMMLLVGSGLLRRRRRWNAPVSTYRYRRRAPLGLAGQLGRAVSDLSSRVRRRTRRTRRRSASRRPRVCITEMSHCSSRPGGSSTPRLMPWIHCAKARSKSVAL